MNNLFVLVLVCLVLLSVLPLSLWKIPPSLGREKRPSVGFYHRLRRLVVRAAAWWVVNVMSPPATAIYEPALALGKKLWPSHAERVAEFLEMKLVPFLLLDFILWPIAEDYLRVKLAMQKAQREEAKHLEAYDYWQSVQQDEENRRKP